MPLWWPLPVLAAFVLSVAVTDMMRRLGERFGIVDIPVPPRKLHEHPTALLGGWGLFSAFAIPTVLVLVASDDLTHGEIDARHILGFLLGGIVLMIGGMLDDRAALPPRLSLLFPVLAASVAVLSGIGVEKLTNPFGNPFIIGTGASMLLTFVWLLGTTYTTKLLDGVDGLAASVALVALLVIAGLASTRMFFQPDVLLLACIAAAGTAGFLLWNFFPARIFLGESGSTFLGFLVGTLAVIAGSKMATALMVLGIPFLDIAFVALRRLSRGDNPFVGDRTHLHHLLLARGWSPRGVVLLYIVIALVFGVTSLVLASWQKVLALGMVFALALGMLWRLTRAEMTYGK